MKKILSLLIALSMMFCIGTLVFAETGNRGDFTDPQYEQYISTDFYKNTVYPEITSYTTSSASLPLQSYPSGSYFSNNGLACTHHNNCNINGSCGCKSYNNSIQCMGFANYVFKQFNGVDCVASNAKGGLSNISATSLQNYISGLKVGSHFRYMGTNGIPHSFIITSKTSTGISVYEANYAANNCLVGTRTITYAQLASQVSSVTNAWSI